LFKRHASTSPRQDRRLGRRFRMPPRYGGRSFSAASALPLERGLIRSGHLPAVVGAAVRQPGRLAALILVLVRTRSEHVFLSGSSAGQALRTYFTQRSLGIFPQNQLCRGVLLLPPDHGDYVRGHRRQALRTNVRRARAAGIRCDVMEDRSLALHEVLDGFRHQGASINDADTDLWLSTVARPELTLMVARDKCGRALAHAGVLVDDMVCVIVFAVATSHEARWALHDYLVRQLIARRVRYLMAAGGGPFGALGFTANVQHYQHLLGYELRHLIPVHPRSMRRVRRLSASLVVMAVASVTLLLPPAAASARANRSPHTVVGQTMSGNHCPR